MTTKRKPRSKAKRSSARVQVISPCLWFDGQAEEAARFYVSVFKKAKIVSITRYPSVGQEVHGREPGSVMTVEFVLNGLPFVALNGGPPANFATMWKDPKSKATERAFMAMMSMKKLDIAALEAARKGTR